jgi:hypothetical protein
MGATRMAFGVCVRSTRIVDKGGKKQNKENRNIKVRTTTKPSYFGCFVLFCSVFFFSPTGKQGLWLMRMQLALPWCYLNC